MRLSRLLATAVAVAALTTGTAIAQQQPGDYGTNANGPLTIFKNMTPEPNSFVVRINGREINDLWAARYDDITTMVQAGRNTLTVAWSRPVQELNFKVAYAPTRNNFRNVLVVKVDAHQKAALRQPGSQNFVFTIPK